MRLIGGNCGDRILHTKEDICPVKRSDDQDESSDIKLMKNIRKYTKVRSNLTRAMMTV